MKKTYRLQNYVVRGKEIFVGLEDSKRTWKLAVRCEKMVIHQVEMLSIVVDEIFGRILLFPPLCGLYRLVC